MKDLGDPPRAGRLLCVDPGEVRVGIATSDPTQTIAGAGDTVAVPRGAGPVQVGEVLAPVIAEQEAVGVVVGYPRTLDGREGKSARSARLLAEHLHELTGLPVVLRDERFTTTEAERVMIQQGTRRAARKKKVDGVAAAFILQGYLDGRRVTRQED